MWSRLENVPCVLEKTVYSAVLGWNVIKISIKSMLSNVSFSVTVSLLISVYMIYWCLWVIEIPYNYCINVDLCLYVYNYLLYKFSCSYIGCINVDKGCITLLNWSFYHYVCSFSLHIPFVLTSILFHINTRSLVCEIVQPCTPTLPCLDTQTSPCRAPVHLAQPPTPLAFSGLFKFHFSPPSHFGLAPPSPCAPCFHPVSGVMQGLSPIMVWEESMEASLLLHFPWQVGSGTLWVPAEGGEGLVRGELQALTPPSLA